MYKTPSIESLESIESINDTAPKPQIQDPTRSSSDAAQQAPDSTQQLSGPVKEASDFKPQKPIASKQLPKSSKLPIRSILKREAAERETPTASSSDAGDSCGYPDCDSDPTGFHDCDDPNRPRVHHTLKGRYSNHKCCPDQLPRAQSSHPVEQSATQTTIPDRQTRNLTLLINELGTMLGKATKREVDDARDALKNTVRRASRKATERAAAGDVPISTIVRLRNRSPALVDLPANSTTMTVNICGTVVSNLVVVTDLNVYHVPGNTNDMAYMANGCGLVENAGAEI